MNPKIYHALELDKILTRLAEHASFSASEALLRALKPTSDLQEAQDRQQTTTEAASLLNENPSLSIGGARDVRPYAQDASVGLTLQPDALLVIKATLQAAGVLRKSLEKVADRYPTLYRYTSGLDDCKHLTDAISQMIDEQGVVLDSASARLSQIRHDAHAAHQRLHTRLQSFLNNSTYAPYLQENLITIRSGRYVIPIKADARGRIKGIVHDQSSSGATLFIEPLATVEINNQLRELELAEEDEIQRLLAALTALIGRDAGRVIHTVDTLAALDVAFAKAKYAAAIRALPPVLVGFDDRRVPGSTVRLFRARHPLLDPDTAVPIDVELDADTFIIVITGPNTGGKTVSLKTVGLLTLMAQCGLHIPAREAVLTVFESVEADIGDEQSIEQSLSTFSAHLRNIIAILEHANDRTLVLLDELGSGTDPAEGAAIARAILDDLRLRGTTTFVATHYPELKTYAHTSAGVRNASMEFDVETLSPTYRLTVGLPGRSNALAIATRLGLPDPIIEAARSFVGEDDLKTDALLDEIHHSREEIRHTQARLAAAEIEVNAMQDRLAARLDALDEEREALLEQTRQQAQAEMDALTEEIAELRRALSRSFPARKTDEPAPIDTLHQFEEQAAALEEVLQPAPPRRSTPRKRVPSTPLQPGEMVYIPRLKIRGEVVSLLDDQDIEVLVGRLRMRLERHEIERRTQPDPAPVESSVYQPLPAADSPGLELHLRGMTVDEALPAVEAYLDRAYLSGLPWVRLVHGKGGGILRQAIRDSLKAHPLVERFQSAGANEGGDGATVVTFVAR